MFKPLKEKFLDPTTDKIRAGQKYRNTKNTAKRGFFQNGPKSEAKFTFLTKFLFQNYMAGLSSIIPDHARARDRDLLYQDLPRNLQTYMRTMMIVTSNNCDDDYDCVKMLIIMICVINIMSVPTRP